MAAASIVVNFDVLENSLAHLVPGGEALTVDRFHFQRVEETLGTGVVVAVALSAHAAHQLVLCQKALVEARAILAATVGMHDYTFWHAPAPEGHLQSLAGQIGGHTLGHGPPDNHAREKVDHDRQIQPAFIGPQVGDIAHPFAVRSRSGEVLPEQVGRHRQVMVGVGGCLELLRGLGAQPLSLQAGRHGLAIVAAALIMQIAGQPRRTAAPLAGSKGSGDLLIEKRLPLLAGRRVLLPMPPDVEAAARCAQDTAHGANAEDA